MKRYESLLRTLRPVAAFAALSPLAAPAAHSQGTSSPGGLPPVVTTPAASNQQPGDARIAQEVTQRLENDPALHGHHLVVAVLNKLVTLTGEVNSPRLSNRAVDVASSAPGVKTVVNRIQVSPVKRPDADILRDVQAALADDPATAPLGLHAAVDGAVVTLSGTVENWEQKDVARWVAEQVSGVREIRNDVRISFTERSDPEIAREVRRRLSGDAQVSDALRVRVENGVVHLTGQVGNAMERTIAVADSWVSGVRDVDGSELEVVEGTEPSKSGPNGTALSDTDLKQSVKERLGYDPRVRKTEIGVAVKSGVVTLSGSVNDARVKEAAGKIARNTRGVHQVKNVLKVQKSKP